MKVVSGRTRCAPCSGTRFRRLQLAQRALAPLFDLVEFALHDADVFELAFEVGAFVGEDLEQALELADAAVVAGVVKIQHFTDFDQREAETFAAQGELEADAVLLVVDAGLAAPLGGEQAFLLVEADGAGGHIEVLRKFANGVSLAGHGIILFSDFPHPSAI